MSDGLEALREATRAYKAARAEGLPRHCVDCGELRPLDEFAGNILFADGFGPYCEKHRIARWHASENKG